ncbi:MAG: lipoate--protein ligase family protein [Bacteroidales bacterium]|nr:lipoate--protein ligase family protein [Bacteroidales bacterium]
MIVLHRPQTNPYFNLAAEEYLVKNTQEPLFMVWQNTSSVVIGKHQNTLKEINFPLLQEMNIPVIRRISGGGTVFHDLGNLNYSFINFGKRESLVNFKKYSQPILEVLQELGVNAYLDGKSDLKIDGLKFSGNASHVHKNTVLHHGTLLYSSELSILNQSISSTLKGIKDKAVVSNRSRVTNIQSHLTSLITLEEFKNKIIEHVSAKFNNCSFRSFSQDELTEIEELANSKYKSWEWNYAYSPRYTLTGKIRATNQNIPFQIEVKNGFITESFFDLGTSSDQMKMQTVFENCMYHASAIQKIYSKNKSFFEQLNIKETDLLNAFLNTSS